VTEGSFTAAQMEAITADDGPLGIIAGPGCGKATVLAGRIAFLIRERGIDPSSILAVSFTTEAARALRAQVLAAPFFDHRSAALGDDDLAC
jgi:DNA helicase-2/ATP-dependent DNA helicase PcrA